jgi:hypothetical protein
MAITMPCPVCNALLKAPDDAAGRTLNCPRCLSPVPLPARPPSQTPPAPSPRAGGEEEILDVLPADEDEGLDTLEVVPDADEVEEVVPVPEGDLLGSSLLLSQREIHIRARKYGLAEKLIDRDLRDYELCHPESGKRLGRAQEVRDAATQAARALVGRFVSAYVEICEGPGRELLATVRRAPGEIWSTKKVLEVRDADDRLIGEYEQTALAFLTNTPLWIRSGSGRKILQLKPQPSRRRYLFVTPGGEPVGQLVEEEQRIRIHVRKRDAPSYFLRFRAALDGRPRDKLLCLAVAVGLHA